VNRLPVETRTEHYAAGLGTALIGLAALFFFLIPFVLLFRWIYQTVAGRWSKEAAGVIVAGLVFGSWCVIAVAFQDYTG
jgi:membrane protease YdiL (CAAX protease family)